MKSKILAFTVGALLATSVAAAPTVTLSVNPTTAAGTATPVLTWSSTEATSCAASGGWTGAKAPSGSETLSPITATTSYTLVCSAAGGTATLTWTPPTQNTDGSALTNLAQYGIYMGTAATGIPRLENIPSGGTTRVLSNISAGTKYFAMTSINAVGIESPQSNVVSKAITVPSASATVTTTISTVPRPPVLVAVQSTAVYELNILGNGQIRLGRNVGEVNRDTACNPNLMVDPNYYPVPKEVVTFTRNSKSSIVVAKCNLTFS